MEFGWIGAIHSVYVPKMRNGILNSLSALRANPIRSNFVNLDIFDFG